MSNEQLPQTVGETQAAVALRIVPPALGQLPALADALAHLECWMPALPNEEYSDEAVAAICTAEHVAPEIRRTVEAIAEATVLIEKMRKEALDAKWAIARSEAMKEVGRRFAARFDEEFIWDQFEIDKRKAFDRQPVVVPKAEQVYARLVATSLLVDVAGRFLCHCVADSVKRGGGEYWIGWEDAQSNVEEIAKSPEGEQCFFAKDYHAMARGLRWSVGGRLARTRDGKLIDASGKEWSKQDLLDLVRSFVSSVMLSDRKLNQVSATDRTANEVLSIFRYMLPVVDAPVIEEAADRWYDRVADGEETKDDVKAAFHQRYGRPMEDDDLKRLYREAGAYPRRVRGVHCVRGIRLRR